ncbi:SDR family oxidoreductase [Flavisphingopyxis soli]|uniref:SDR family oxidoreductase n=1 Tax=Flavisphingopyxis soli TaxID=2601267 RepID=UPI00137598A1|nr:SDR family oxidoreductase [Sphingorhabdus soli]
MKILVAGAAGAVGNMLVSDLVEAGHEVTGLVHSQDKISCVEQAGGRAIVADVTAPDTLAQPLSNMDVVIFAAGSGGKAVEAVDRDGAINLIDAAVNEGVDRFVMLSSMSADTPENGPDELKSYLEAKQAADRHLERSGLTYVIVRPAALTDEKGRGHIRVGHDLEAKDAQITRADVAKTLAIVSTATGVKNSTFEIIEGDLTIREAIECIQA